LLDISATGIRDRIAGDRSPRYLFPDAVWDEIRRLGLYGCPPGRR
jgi:nicotinate-nucleotide adenylyltransferase